MIRKRLGASTDDYDTEDRFYRDSVILLKKNETVYIYNKKILNRLNSRFKDLKIEYEDFYWKVKV